MIALLAAVFIASLLGSLHCAGMCGPFVALASGALPGGATAAQQRGARKSLSVFPTVLQTQTAYHMGRLLTYLVMGGAAGVLGAALDLGGSMLGIQRAAAILAGATMIVMGIAALGQIGGLSVRLPAMPRALQSLAAGLHRRIALLPALPRALALGLLTTLLPCGWLYAFVIAAAGTAGLLPGVAIMAAFWLGTIPLLAAVGFGTHLLCGALRARLPVITSLALVALGLLSVFGRVGLPSDLYQRVAAQTAGGADARESVQRLNGDEMPCCAHEVHE